MQYQYVVTLKRDSQKYIDRISILVCSFSLLIFVYEQLRSGHFSFFLSFFAALILTGILLNIFASGKETGKRSFPGTRFRNWLLLAGVAWLGMPYLQWMAVLLFLLAFLEYQARYPLEIGFSDDRIVINTLIKKRIDWAVFNNVVLKDGLLTLDYKGDRLFQKEVLDGEEEDADEDEFNEYCRNQLARVAMAARSPE